MTIYEEQGYKSRKDYLKSLAEEYGMEYFRIQMLADLYGPNEDFDGLVTALEDLNHF